jgi:hypothetical protein
MTIKDSSMVEHRLMKSVVTGSNPVPTRNNKGSRLKATGSKSQIEQGSMGQGSKDVAQGVIASERPLESYVSVFSPGTSEASSLGAKTTSN